MDSATISALAALSGAVIGGVTSFGTSWLSQQTQAKVQARASMFTAVAMDVENIDDHRQRDLVVDSSVTLDWANERTQRFLQEHLDALREVAASEESGHDTQSNPEAIREVARILRENLAIASR